MQSRKIIFVILGITILLACNIFGSRSVKDSVIFQDDFSGDSAAWKVWFEENRSAASVNDGKFVMILEEENSDILSPNHISNPDVAISVEISKEHGSDDNLLGLFCRYSNEDNYYGFFITSDGYFGIARKKNGDLQLLNSESMEYSEHIIKGEGINHLLGICDKESLSFVLNGNLLSEVHDTALREGRNGLMIGSFSEPDGLVVMFDNYIVYSK